MKGLILFVFAAVTAMFANVRSAQAEISVGYHWEVGQDFRSGLVFGYGSEQNAILTNQSSGMNYYINENGEPMIFAWATFNGVYGDPTSWNSYYDVLAGGMDYHTSLELREYSYDGTVFATQESVSVFADSTYQLFNHSFYFNMSAMMNTRFFGIGAIPISAQSSGWVNEAPPGWTSTWQVNFSSTWRVTAEFTPVGPVPAPGAASLLGLGGLMAVRRQRR